MPRPLKPMQVGDVYLRGPRVRVPLMLNRNTNTFFAEYGTERVESDTAHEAKRLAETKLGRIEYRWEPFILIEVDNRKIDWQRPHEAAVRHVYGVGLEFMRCERSPSPSKPGQFVKRPHLLDVQADGSGHKAEMRESFQDITSAYWDQDATCIPYTEEAWAALNAVANAIEQAHEKLKAIMHPDGVEARLRRIAQVGTRLLGGGRG